MNGRRPVNLKGRRFFRLKVIKRVGTQNNSPLWLCICDCGERRNVTNRNLTHFVHPVKSCGCFRREFLAKCSRSRSRVARSKAKLKLARSS